MKTIKSILAIILLLVIFACGSENKKTVCDYITVDVNGNYPEKELIVQDFMNVEYIPLETNDQFITQGLVKAIGKEIIIVTNRIIDGDIFIFDRKTGKGLRKINRLGQGPEEYTQFTDIILDEDNNELFVVAYNARNILVYDLFGNYKRSFEFTDEISYYNYTFNYNRDNLICYKSYLPDIETEHSSHIIISKKDGAITREIQLPFEEIRTPVIIQEEGSVTPGFFLLVPNYENWVIMRTSSDTIYNYSPNGNLTPIIVRTPSIHSMSPEIFLFPTLVSDDYYFMRTMKKELDFKTFKGFDGVNLMYDKEEGAIFKYMMYNDDFSTKQSISLGQQPGSTVNPEVATCLSLNAFDLVEAFEKGELKGELKEIACDLNEESNPVIMLIMPRK